MLSNIRVLDLADEKGLMCGRILSDLGAEVVKIEPPCGDPCRVKGPFVHGQSDKEQGLSWLYFNTNKKSITLNLSTDYGLKIFRLLAKSADVLVETFRPGYVQELGIDHCQLSRLNPGLVVVSVTPFGQDGPCQDFKDSDLVALAMGGFLNTCGSEDRPPVRPSVEQAYVQAGAQAAAASLIALFYKETTGLGQHLDLSVQAAVFSTLSSPVQTWELSREVQHRSGKNKRGNVYVRSVWPCKDGYVSWQLVVGPTGPRIRRLVEWMMEEGRAGELPGVNWTKVDLQVVAQGQVDRWEDLFGDFFVQKTMADLYDNAVRRGILLFPVNTIPDAFRNPQLRARGFFQKVKHPEQGDSLMYPGSFLKGSATETPSKTRAPLLGEHNLQVYVSELGFTREEVAILKEEGVI